MRPIQIKDTILSPFSPAASPRLRHALGAWRCGAGSQTLCLSGGRNCGKTVSLWLLLLDLHQRLPGLQSLILRKEAASIKHSVFKTLPSRLLAHPLGDRTQNPLKVHGGPNQPQHIDFDNGGQCVFGGLDDVKKYNGGEFDIIWINEIHRIDSGEMIQELLGGMAGGRGGTLRLNGRRHTLFMADCNPASPHHWWYKMGEAGTADWWYSFTHKDHREHYDWQQQNWTELGLQTRHELLEAYPPGFNRQRMVYGKWTSAEGLVYSMWDENVHEVVMKREDFPASTYWAIGIDIGGSAKSPWAVTLGGRVGKTWNIYKEMCHRHLTTRALLDKLEANLERWGIPPALIQAVVVDHNNESFRHDLAQRGYAVKLAKKKQVVEHINTVKECISANNLYVNKTSLEERDETYSQAQGWKEEVKSYKYEDEATQRTSANPDKPIQENNHWMDSTGYLLHTLRLDEEPIPRETGVVVRMGGRRRR